VKGPGEEQAAAASAAEKLAAWFASRMPDDWFGEAPVITLDREEITIIGELPVPADEAAELTAAERAAAAVSHVRRFREQTRQQRIEIAREAEHRFGRKVSWGVICGEKIVMFTTFSVPVMTRLRQPERLVLDTLVDAGVARSRSDALAWCVRLVGEHEEAWLAELRAALQHVEQVRADGPRS
jgi:flavin-binding protein dodecin